MQDNGQNQQRWSGPFGMGQQGYLIALVILLAPLMLTLIIIALTGQQQTPFP